MQQPDTTETGAFIQDGYDSTGNAIAVEIYDPRTGLTVNSDAAVTLTLGYNPAGGTLIGGAATAAVAGVATFPALTVNRPGPYKLLASSPVASNSQLSDQFMVSDTVTACIGTGCTFKETQANNSYTTTPKNGVAGAGFAATLNLLGIRVSCDFEPFFYSDARQPNSVWYVYDDDTSIKTNVIVISKAVVQITPENGASKYRVCYSSPEPFIDRTGGLAQPDPWADGPSAYFGETWYTGLLPDCGKKNPESKAPCSLGWVASGPGDRVGTFLTPPGDPGYR